MERADGGDHEISTNNDFKLMGDLDFGFDSDEMGDYDFGRGFDGGFGFRPSFFRFDDKFLRGCGSTIITGGMYKGEKIHTPGGETHPMSSRARLAIFNMIGEDVQNAFVLDAYAGSGALGLEALSRGAWLALFIDNDPKAVKIINRNAEDLGFREKGSGAMLKNIRKEAPTATDRFSLVFADPPYENYEPEMITELARLTAESGMLIASTPEPGPEIEGMEKVKEKKYARAHITIYKWIGGKHIEDRE